MSPLATRYDVIIVGARCAGAATALRLARGGARVLLVDRGGPDDDALSTHALMRPAVALLARWGLLDQVIAAGTPPVRTTTFHYGEQAVAVALKPRDGVDALYAPRRTVLDPLLVAAARAAGAEVHHHTRLRGLVRDGGARVRGAVLEHAGARHAIAADLVIGADGLGSMVARLVGAGELRVARHKTATVYGHVPGLAVDGYQWLFGPAAGGGAIPTNGGTCVFVTVPAARYHEQLRHDLRGSYHQILAELAPELAARVAAAPPATLRPFAGRRGFLRRAHGPGWALVGDAGYFKDPFTAHGITDALRDAALLATAVVAGGDDALADYQATRDQLSTRLFELTDAIASFAWTLPGLAELHRQLQREMARELAHVLAMGASAGCDDLPPGPGVQASYSVRSPTITSGPPRAARAPCDDVR